MPDTTCLAHSEHSALREVILEHLLTGAILQRLWQRGIRDAEILHSEFDAGGFDLVLTRGSVTRHIQLKSSILGGKTRSQKINLRLLTRPAGCVVWMVITDDLGFDHFLWLGAAPDQSLVLGDDLKPARHTKGDSTGTKHERPGTRVVPKTRFTRIDGTDALIDRLLGTG